MTVYLESGKGFERERQVVKPGEAFKAKIPVGLMTIDHDREGKLITPDGVQKMSPPEGLGEYVIAGSIEIKHTLVGPTFTHVQEQGVLRIGSEVVGAVSQEALSTGVTIYHETPDGHGGTKYVRGRLFSDAPQEVRWQKQI